MNLKETDENDHDTEAPECKAFDMQIRNDQNEYKSKSKAVSLLVALKVNTPSPIAASMTSFTLQRCPDSERQRRIAPVPMGVGPPVPAGFG